MDKQERAKLSWELVRASNDLKALNRTRGPLGHGVIYIADKAERQTVLRARIAELNTLLGR